MADCAAQATGSSVADVIGLILNQALKSKLEYKPVISENSDGTHLCR